MHTFVYERIPNTTTTANPAQTQPSPDPDPDAETPSNTQTHPSSQPERKRLGVVEPVENRAAGLFSRDGRVIFYIFYKLIALFRKIMEHIAPF